MRVKSESTVRPERVVVEQFPDGTKNIRLSDNIVESTGESGTVYTYDEVEFIAPEGREITAESVIADFEAWWLYGSASGEPVTVEDRLNALEEAVLGLIGGV